MELHKHPFLVFPENKDQKSVSRVFSGTVRNSVVLSKGTLYSYLILIWFHLRMQATVD